MTPPGPKRPPTPSPTRSYPYEVDDEDKTPVSGDPFVSLEHRSKRTHEDTKAALGEIQRVSQRVEAMDRTLTQYIERDQREHGELKSANEKTELALLALDKNQAVGNKMLELIHEDVRSIKRVEEHKTKVTIETDAVVKRTQIEDAADSKKVRRERNLKILGILGGAVGSGGIVVTIVLALLGKC